MKYGLLALACLAAVGSAGAMGAANGALGTRAQQAITQLRANPVLANVSVHDGFRVRDALVDADGTEHVRLDRSYAGLPVIGGDVVVHSRNGILKGITLGQRQTIHVAVIPKLSGDAAVVVAGTRFGADFAGVPSRSLVVYARSSAPKLAWKIGMENDAADMTYIVDANSGAVLDAWSNRETIAKVGIGHSLYSGDVVLTTNSVPVGYELRDPSRGGSYVVDGSNSRTSGQVYKDADNIWGNLASTDPATAAVDAQFGVGTTWDYYLNMFGRRGIGDDGKGAYSRVHYGRTYANAYWSDGCFCMTYGDGDGHVMGAMVSLDVSGHEMSHGVTSRTAALVYSGESGGLNEATSDIFGTMVEFYANNAVDAPDYLIGERLIKSNVPGSANQAALRFMFKPSLDGRSPDCWYGGIGNLDVHYSSGIANHFYYLLAEGTAPKTFSGVVHSSPTCNSSTLAGIGRTKAQQIWYRALTVYFTSTTDYAGARLATISAAKDLYGSNSAEAVAVTATWSAVGVN